MKKFMITPGITDLNRGDQALIWLIQDIVEESGMGAKCKLLQSGNNESEIVNQSKQSIDLGFEVMTPLLLHPGRGKEKKEVGHSYLTKIRWAVTGVFDLFKSALLLSKNPLMKKIGINSLNKEQNKTYKEFYDMDMLIVKGGGFLHTYNRLTDLYYLYYGLYNLLLAKRLNKKIIIMPNSFGPFKGKLEKKIVKKVLSKCELIYARETSSKHYLSNLLNQKVNLSPDLGFYIKNYEKYKEYNFPEIKELSNKVAVTMRPYRFPEGGNSEEKYNFYIKEMSEVSKGLIEKGYHPVFIAHTLGPSAHEDDRIAIESVIDLLKDNDVSNKSFTYIDDEKMDCYKITSLYSHMDFIIGTRFHSVIFAMTSLVPAIAISYSGHKTTGIMSDMGLEEYTVDIGTISKEDILNKFDNLVSNKVEVQNKIKDYLEKAESEKNILISKLKSILN